MQDTNKQEDTLLISKIQDKIKFCATKNKVENTDFLNMHEKEVARKVLEENSINNYFFFGGYDESEREMLFLYPEKLEESLVKNTIEKYIAVIRITLPKIENYSHREYLGGIMKLGVDRKKVGDIIVTANRCRYNYFYRYYKISRN